MGILHVEADARSVGEADDGRIAGEEVGEVGADDGQRARGGQQERRVEGRRRYKWQIERDSTFLVSVGRQDARAVGR